MGDASQWRALAPALVLIATPIGNLKDLTTNALHALSDCDVLFCEDTRRTGKLLQAYQLSKRCVSLHEHNERQRAPQVIAQLRSGALCGLVSDAGTPLVSDPGYNLVGAVIEAGFDVYHAPGPSAVLTALVLSGLPSDDFRFVGFMPKTGSKRRRRLADLSTVGTSYIFFESGNRILAFLDDVLTVLGDKPCAIARELTKRFETLYRGTASELIARIKEGETMAGEVTVVVDNRPGIAATFGTEALLILVRHFVDGGDSESFAIKRVTALTGVKKRALYQLWLANSHSA